MLILVYVSDSAFFFRPCSDLLYIMIPTTINKQTGNKNAAISFDWIP